LEIDVFSGENAGLVIAEIELGHEPDHFARPPWLAAELPGSHDTTTAPCSGILNLSGA
jgi:CYTH domain-containing protein